MREKIKSKLISEYSYSLYTASITADDLCNLLYPDLKTAVLKWVYTNKETPISDNHYPTYVLVRKYHMSYPASLIFINWYRTDPSSAVTALKARM